MTSIEFLRDVLHNNPAALSALNHLTEKKAVVDVVPTADYIWSQAWNWKITKDELKKKLSELS